MAAFVVTRTIRAFDPRSWTRQQLVGMANNNQATVVVGSNTIDAADAASRKLYGGPQFEIFGTTDSNTAAASSPVISLSDEGVIFPANTTRDIEVEVLAFNGANRYRYRTRQRIAGATDPTLGGPEQYLTSCLARYVCTTDGSTTSVEVAAECVGPEWHDGAAPVAGAFSGGAATVQWLGANLPSRTFTPLSCQNNLTAAATNENFIAMIQQTISLTNTTTVVAGVDVAGTETAAIGAGRIEASAFITPPVHTPVLIDTVSAPDEVFIGALGISSDVVTWAIRVFVGDLVSAGPLV